MGVNKRQNWVAGSRGLLGSKRSTVRTALIGSVKDEGNL